MLTNQELNEAIRTAQSVGDCSDPRYLDHLHALRAEQLRRATAKDEPGGWISVKDRLPTEEDYGVHDDVLVRFRYIDVPGRPWSIDESRIHEGQEQNGGWGFGSCDYAEVSHWMRKDSLLERLP